MPRVQLLLWVCLLWISNICTADGLPFRGMYVSPYDPTETGMFGDIIADPCKVDALAHFVQAHSIKSLSLYDLHRILPDEVLTEQLAHLVQHVRKFGVEEVIAIGGGKLLDFERIGGYLSKHTPEEQFDGLLTEIEFWNQPGVDVKFTDFVSLLQQIKGLNLTARGKTLPVGVYLGYLVESGSTSALQKAETLARIADRIYLHCYVQQGHQTYGACQERLRVFADTGVSVQVMPMFSAEGQEFHAGYPFEGDYFWTNGIAEGQELFQAAFAADTQMMNSNVHLAGFQYYEYRYMGRYVRTA